MEEGPGTPHVILQLFIFYVIEAVYLHTVSTIVHVFFVGGVCLSNITFVLFRVSYSDDGHFF